MYVVSLTFFRENVLVPAKHLSIWRHVSMVSGIALRSYCNLVSSPKMPLSPHVMHDVYAGHWMLAVEVVVSAAEQHDFAFRSLS